MNDKAFAVEIIKLLSALESWSFANDRRLPDHTLEQLEEIMDRLTQEVLK